MVQPSIAWWMRIVFLGLLRARKGCCAISSGPRDEETANCLYIVKYEGNMLKWAECDAQPAMARERLTSGHPTP